MTPEESLDDIILLKSKDLNDYLEDIVELSKAHPEVREELQVIFFHYISISEGTEEDRMSHDRWGRATLGMGALGDIGAELRSRMGKHLHGVEPTEWLLDYFIDKRNNPKLKTDVQAINDVRDTADFKKLILDLTGHSKLKISILQSDISLTSDEKKGFIQQLIEAREIGLSSGKKSSVKDIDSCLKKMQSHGHTAGLDIEMPASIKSNKSLSKRLQNMVKTVTDKLAKKQSKSVTAKPKLSPKKPQKCEDQPNNRLAFIVRLALVIIPSTI